jgi:hypothetical protein
MRPYGDFDYRGFVVGQISSSTAEATRLAFSGKAINFLLHIEPQVGVVSHEMPFRISEFDATGYDSPAEDEIIDTADAEGPDCIARRVDHWFAAQVERRIHEYRHALASFEGS